ncbi:MAG TPA: redoxin domain-containing protein [Acidobacteriota bacterium]|nr:redoxin domain-containing protein [Acidobacteriota bacterium]
MTRVLLPIIIFGALLALAACSSDETGARTESQAPAQTPVAKLEAPEASADPGNPEVVNLDANAVSWTAADLDGNLHHSGKWIGKQPVVINFWGTWCPPCRREIPDLVRLYSEYKPQGVEIVSFAVRDRPEAVRRYAEKARMEWVMLMMDEQVYKDYQLTGGVPTTIFLDVTGKEVGRFVGMRDYTTLKRGFDAIL